MVLNFEDTNKDPIARQSNQVFIRNQWFLNSVESLIIKLY